MQLTAMLLNISQVTRGRVAAQAPSLCAHQSLTSAVGLPWRLWDPSHTVLASKLCKLACSTPQSWPPVSHILAVSTQSSKTRPRSSPCDMHTSLSICAMLLQLERSTLMTSSGSCHQAQDDTATLEMQKAGPGPKKGATCSSDMPGLPLACMACSAWRRHRYTHSGEPTLTTSQASTCASQATS